MNDCAFVGDSIAVQLWQAKTECHRYAIGGINTWQMNNAPFVLNAMPWHLDADTVVIAMGSNDHTGVNTVRELTILRGRIVAKRVLWLVPAINKPSVQSAVRLVAAIHRDALVLMDGRVHPDGIHLSQRGVNEVINEVWR